MKSRYSAENKFYNIYRGIVVDNNDPLNKGRLKIFVPGVYASRYEDTPKYLPWALPAMSIFGGGGPNLNYLDGLTLNKEVGWSSVLHAGVSPDGGAQVFLFFENGDINHPVYFAVSQSGDGWLSEHPNQHVFNTDNVRIRVDESSRNTEDNKGKKWNTHEKSTCRFDSYTKHISDLGKEQLKKDSKEKTWNFADTQVKNLETRIDIEIKAEDINAVNLNIHGNVNMHIDGNWYIEHIGNKYEYHQGDHYIKHDGGTYIEQKGIYKSVHEGNRSYNQTGKYNYIQDGDAIITRTGTLFEKINNDVKKEYDQNYELKIGGKYIESYDGDRTINIGGNYNEVIKKNKNEKILGSLETTVGGHYETTVEENITFISKKGNWTVKTEGLFELFDKDDNLTIDGYNNIGNKGNIQFLSTFGNIQLQCIKNDNKANFHKKSVVIPWNPGFLAEIEKNITLYPDFNKIQSVTNGLDFPTDIFDFAGFVNFFKSLPDLLIYDGLPVFLPAKMIFQNPNIQSPNNTEDLNWIPKFRSETSDWRSGDNESYWKIPGRLIGNINIETWSGDINIKTDSELGCAGNINISANEKLGTFPGYKIGCVNISNSATNRIYPDPRDLFFDSDFMKRMKGDLCLFSHGTSTELAKLKGNILLPQLTSKLINQIGLSLSLHAFDYNEFYKYNTLNILTNGFEIDEENIPLKKIDEMKKLRGPTLGCLRCISDYFLGIPGVQELCYISENLNNFSTAGIHRYGFSKFNPYDKENPRGVFNILSEDFNKISMGDGHAIDIGFTDRENCGGNIGSFNIFSQNNVQISSGKNYYLNSNTNIPNATRSVSHIVTEKVLDDFPPTILTNGINKLNEIWSSTGGLVFEIEDGVIKILKFLGDILSVDTGIKILNIMPKIEYISLGYINSLQENIGRKISYLDSEVDTYSLDLGFDFENIKDLLSSNDFSKLKISFSKDEYLLQSHVGTYNKTYKSGFFGSFCINEFNQNITITIELNENYNTYSWADNNLKYSQVRAYNDRFYLRWNLKESTPKSYFPDWEFKNEHLYSYSLGNGITKGEHAIDISKYGYHDPMLLINIIEPKPGESYVDVTTNDSYFTSNSESKWSTFLKGPCRNIISNVNRNAGESVNVSINNIASNSISNILTHTSPINNNALILNSLGGTNIVKIESNNEGEGSSNAIEVIQNGAEENIISVTNSTSNNSKYNAIDVNNGINASRESSNEIIVNNGEGSTKGNNLTTVNTGLNSKNSTNRYIVNTGNISKGPMIVGDQELNEIILNCSPNSNSASYMLHANKYHGGDKLYLETYITEYSEIEKILTTRFITTNSEENIINTNQHKINSASFIEFNSAKINENFKSLNKPKILPPTLALVEIIRTYNSKVRDIFGKIKNLFS